MAANNPAAAFKIKSTRCCECMPVEVGFVSLDTATLGLPPRFGIHALTQITVWYAICASMMRTRNGMLKISVIDSRTERRLLLEGKLIAPWLAELKAAWRAANEELAGRALVVDLRNITAISQEGENAISEFINGGARFRCSGVLTRHVIQQLRRRSKSNSNEEIQAVHSSVRNERGQK
jgi:hypothetical protein